MTYRASYLSPLGAITLASDGKALTGLWFDGQKYFGSTLPVETKQGDCPVFAQAKRWLDSYFAGEKPDFTPPLSNKARVIRLITGYHKVRKGDSAQGYHQSLIDITPARVLEELNALLSSEEA